MEGDDLPVIVEDRRSRRAWSRVSLIVEEVFEKVDQAVLPQCQLLRLATRMLDDVDGLPEEDLPLGFDQAVPPLLREACAIETVLCDRDKAVVKLSIGKEERLRF